MLLTDVIQNLRDKCVNKNDLDPAYLHETPGLAWISASKISKI